MRYARHSIDLRPTLAMLFVAASVALTAACSGSDSLPNPTVSQNLSTLPTFGYVLDPNQPCMAPESIATSIRLSNDPGTAKVYAATPQEFDEGYATQLARRLGIEATPQREASGDYTAEDRHGSLVVGTNPDYIFYHRTVAPTGTAPAEVISDDQARQAAEDFLKSVALYPVSPVQATVKQTPDSIEVVFTPQDMTLSIETIEAITVTCGRAARF